MYEENESISEMAKETLRLTKENNRMIKAMRRDAFISGIVRIALWLLALGIAYYFATAYLEPMLSMFNGEGGMSPDDIRRLFEDYQRQFGQ
jgi:hypothetical protein